MKFHILSYRKIRGWIGVAVCGAILSLTANSNAQSAGTGSIQGSITDATGAIIQNATVTVTNAATQVKTVAITEGNGHYSLPNLAIGTYTLDVVAPGFEQYSQTKIVLEVGSSISINVPMTVGRTDQKIEVQASGLALQTEDSSFKQTIDSQTVTEMPLNGRQMTSLITLSGGSTSAPAGDFTGSKYSYQTISVSIAGGMGNTTMWRLDGGDNNDYMANGNLPFPEGHAAPEPVWRHIRRPHPSGQALRFRRISAQPVKTVSEPADGPRAYCCKPRRGLLRHGWTELHFERQVPSTRRPQDRHEAEQRHLPEPTHLQSAIAEAVELLAEKS